MPEPTSVLTAWARNLEVDRALLRHLTPEMLSARTPGGGFTVGQHLAHMVGVTKHWGMLIDPERLEPLPDLVEEVGGSFVAESDLARIDDVLGRTAAAAAAATEARPEGSSDSPHADAPACLIPMLVHDAHHRGQIVPALKTAGHPLPEEDALWAPWRS